MGPPLLFLTSLAATNDSFLSMACAGLIGLLFGAVLTFFGYRLFIILLPIWGFFFGLNLGAQTMQALFGEGFLATVTSWVVGLIVALLFAGLSYLFYLAAVAIAGGSLGYTIVVGILLAIGLPMGILVWLVGAAAFVVMAFVTIRFNVQKWVVEIATGVLGAAVTVAVPLLLFSPAADVMANPVKVALNSSPLLTIMFIILAVVGIAFQVQTNRTFEVDQYNRLETPAPVA